MATKTKEKTTEIREVETDELKVITPEHLSHLQTTVRTIDALTADIGRMETQKYSLLVAMQKVQSQIDDMRELFVKEYGSDNINIQTGEIKPAVENIDNGEINS
tara:strand:+ start:879 stop:1190 length:312 start_codon:yes stop_codon:yes gene_type:complete